MRILVLIPYFWPSLSFGGPVKVTYELCRELSKKHEVSVYTSDAWDQKRRLEKYEMLKKTKHFTTFYFRNIVNSFAFSKRIYTNFGVIPAFIKNKHEYDIVHINDVFSIPQVVVSTFAKLYKIPFVVSTHGVDMLGTKNKSFVKKILYLLLVRSMLNNARCVIATSEGEKKILENQGFENVSVVYNGVDFRNSFDVKRNYSKKKILTLLYIGRINKLKGLHYLIKALSRVKKQYNLLIAGPDDGEKENLLDLTKKLKVDKTVSFLGFVDERQKEELYKKSDIFVYPSRLEGFSISILEAMQRGLPVIATYACNFPDISKFKAGIEIPQKQITKVLVRKLKRLYKERNGLQEMSKNARRLIMNKYSIEVMAKQFEKVYKV